MSNGVKKNFIYNTFYQILVILLPIITTPYISRVLGPNMIGIYSYSYSIAYYFGIFIILGLTNYGNRTIAMVKNDKNKLSKTFFEIYCMQIIMGIIVLIIYIIFTIFFNNNMMAWIMIIYIIANILDVNWFFFGMEQFKITVIRSTLIKLLTTICIFVFVRGCDDIYIYGTIMMIGILISQLSVLPFIFKHIKLEKIRLLDVLLHVKPNLVLFIPIIAISLYKQMDKIMLGKMTDMVQVGYYESSEKIMQLPLALIIALGNVMLPRMSNLIANDNFEKAENQIYKSLILSVFLSSSMSFGIMGIAQEFVPIFYGNGYDTCIILFQILMPSCIFLAFSNVIRTQFLIPCKKDKVFIVSVCLGAIINLIINIILIPRYAAIGAASGTLIAEGVVCIYQIYKVKNYLDMRKYLIQSVPYLIFGIFMYIIIFFINNIIVLNVYLKLIIKVLIGMISYLMCIFIFFKLKRNTLDYLKENVK